MLPNPHRKLPARISPALLLSFWLAVSAGMAQEVSWARRGPECNLRGSTETLSCGGMGTYTFGSTRELIGGPEGCETLASAEDDPLLVVDSERDASDADRDACLDCDAEGRIFHKKVAAIDWGQGNHGEWVRKSFVMMGAPAPKFYYLDDPGLTTTQALPGATDLHVLEQLCRVVEAEVPHKLLNLSFGRLLETEPCSGGDSIRCEIHRVLEYLRSDLGVLVLAAAGNHDELLFPASDPSTLAVGGLDLNLHWPTGTVEPSAETPSGYDALLPGAGLIIPIQASWGQTYWSLPAGSSFANSVLTAWLSKWDDAHPGSIDQLIADDPLLVSMSIGPDGFYLTADGVPYLNSRFDEIDDLFYRAVGLDPETVNATGGIPYDYPLEMTAEPLDLTLPTSRPRVTHDTNQPTPGSGPCIPCRLRRRSLRSVSGNPVVEVKVYTRPAVAGISVLDVYLAAGEEIYGLDADETDNGYERLIAALDFGSKTSVPVFEIPEELLDGRPLSLIVAYTRDADQIDFWDAVPLLQHLDERRPIFSSGFENQLTFWADPSEG